MVILFERPTRVVRIVPVPYPHPRPDARPMLAALQDEILRELGISRDEGRAAARVPVGRAVRIGA